MNYETMGYAKDRYGNNFQRNWNCMPGFKKKRFENHIRNVWGF